MYPEREADYDFRLDPRFVEFRPFPVECFPAPVRNFVVAHAKSMDCDESAVALPVLSALAAAIGSTRRIRLKRTWIEPAVLWTALVTNRGVRQDRPLEAATEPLLDRQDQSFRELDLKLRQYGPAWNRYRIRKRNYTGPDPLPPEPLEPVADRYVASDWNMRTLIPLLSRQPRGLLVCTEDLDGWLGRSPRGRTGPDVAHWLDVYQGRTLQVDRPSSGKSFQKRVPDATVSLTGVIPQDVLWQKLSKSRTLCPLFSRMLVAYPPQRPRRWTEEEVQPEQIDAYAAVVNRLVSLKFAGEAEDNGEVRGDRAQGHRTAQGHEVAQPPPSPRDKPGGGEVVSGPGIGPLDPEMLRDLTNPDRLEAAIRCADEMYARALAAQAAARNGSFVDETPKPQSSNGSAAQAGSGPSEPVLVEMSEEAKLSFAVFMDALAPELRDADDVLGASLGHLEGYAVRLALVLHLARWAAGERVDPNLCDGISMERGARLARWFAYESRRVHAVLREPEDEFEMRRLIRWLQRRGGMATPRDLCRANTRIYPTSKLAEKAMDQLVEWKLADWIDMPAGEQGGRPYRLLRHRRPHEINLNDPGSVGCEDSRGGAREGCVGFAVGESVKQNGHGASDGWPGLERFAKPRCNGVAVVDASSPTVDSRRTSVQHSLGASEALDPSHPDEVNVSNDPGSVGREDKRGGAREGCVGFDIEESVTQNGHGGTQREQTQEEFEAEQRWVKQRIYELSRMPRRLPDEYEELKKEWAEEIADRYPSEVGTK